MKTPRFRYLRADSVGSALQALADNADARKLAPLAGMSQQVAHQVDAGAVE